MTPEIRARLRKYKDLRTSVRNSASVAIGGGRFEIEFVLRGPELETLSKYAEELRKRAPDLGILDADTSLKLDKPELRVEIDRTRAADLGVATEDVASALRLMVGGDQRVLPDAVLGSQLFPDVGVKRHVNVLEVAVPDEIGARDQQFFRRGAENLERALQLELVHRLFDREGGADHDRRVHVVPLGVSGRSFDHRLVIGHAGSLRVSRSGVVLSVQRDDRCARSVGRQESRRHPGDSALNFESALFQDLRHELGSLEFLHPELKNLPQRRRLFRANRSMRDVESSVNLWVKTFDNIEVEDDE